LGYGFGHLLGWKRGGTGKMEVKIPGTVKKRLRRGGGTGFVEQCVDPFLGLFKPYTAMAFALLLHILKKDKKKLKFWINKLKIK